MHQQAVGSGGRVHCVLCCVCLVNEGGCGG